MLAEKQVTGGELGSAIGRLLRAAQHRVQADKQSQVADPTPSAKELADAVQHAEQIISAEVGGEKWK